MANEKKHGKKVIRRRRLVANGWLDRVEQRERADKEREEIMEMMREYRSIARTLMEQHSAPPTTSPAPFPTPTDTAPVRPAAPHLAPKSDPGNNEFEHELTALINRYSLEQYTNIPDFILARHMVASLMELEHTVQGTHGWYGGQIWLRPTPRNGE